MAEDEYGEKSHSHTSPGGWHFTTIENKRPNKPSNPSPSDNSENVSISPTFSWSGGDPDGDDVTYRLYYRKAGLSFYPTTPQYEGSNTSFQVNRGLEFGKEYVWKVVAEDEYGEKSHSHTSPAGWHFTCDEAPFTELAEWQNTLRISLSQSNVCKDVTLKVIVSGSVFGNLTAVILDKDGLFQKDDPITTVALVDQGNGNFKGDWETIWIEDKLFSNQAKTQEQPLSTTEKSNLFTPTISELYFEVWDGVLNLGESGILKVEDLDNPNAPTLNTIDGDDIIEYSNDSKFLNPLDNNKMDIPFSWNPPINENCQSEIEKYRIEISSDKNFETIVKSDVLNDTQKTFSLSVGIYFWRVSARDKANNPSDWSEANWATKSLIIKIPYILRITEVHPTIDIGEKRPLLLVHGWQFEGVPDSPDSSIWINFINYFEDSPELKNNFKLYYVNYYSNYISAQALGELFRKEFEQVRVANFPSRNVSIVAHSMGGLVSKAFMYSTQDNVQGGGFVSDFITLGTPHHGSPMANGPARNFPYLIYTLVLDPLLIARVQLVEDYLILIGSPSYLQVNRSDMRWDNFDGLFKYNLFTKEQNNWLDTLNQQSKYDHKITAYSGNGGRHDITTGSQNFAYGAGYDYMKAIGLHFNDGIVPRISAEFEGHNLKNKRFFDGYNHTMIGSGNGTNGLFQAIKSDLLGDSESIITADPNIIAFGNTLIDNAIEQTFSITNNGSVVLSISDLVISGGDETQFTIDIDQSLEFDIAVGETKEIQIIFNPTTVGEKYAVLNIYNNSSNQSPKASVDLYGIATEDNIRTIDVVSETPLDFGEILSNNNSMSAINLKNTGTSDISVSQLIIEGISQDEFTIKSPAESTFNIAPNETQQIIILFSPNSSGQKTASLAITNNSDNSPELTIDLRGKGLKQPSNLATLNNIFVDEVSIEDFDYQTLNYEVVLPKYVTEVPSVEVISTNENATTEIKQAQSLPGSTLIIVTSEDITSTLTYTVDFLLAPNKKPIVVNDAFSIEENSIVGTSVGTALASDPEDDDLSFSIVSGNDLGTFKMDQSMGEITVNDAEPLDFETNPTFELLVEANDGKLSGTSTIIVNLIDVNEAPSIDDDTFTIDENSPTGTSVGIVTASDVDGDDLTFSIKSGNINSTFEIDPSTGELKVEDSTELDYEKQTFIELVVEVTDDGEGNLKDEDTITVNIIDKNFAPYPATHMSPTDGETLTFKQLIFKWTCNDQDGDQLTYSFFLQYTEGNWEELAKGLTEPNYIINDELAPGVYNWKIDATDGEFTVSSEPTSFKRNAPPELPIHILPENGETVKGEPITFIWTCDDQDGDQLTYSFFLQYTEGNWEELAKGLTEPNYIINDELAPGVYNWKIDATDGEFTVISEPTSFRFNVPPEIPIQISPANGEFVNGTPITFTWNCEDPDGDKLNYSFLLKYPDGNWKDLATNLTEPEYILDEELTKGDYVWKIEANDGQFTVISDPSHFSFNNPPNLPQHKSPSGIEPIARKPWETIKFMWSCIDEDGDNLTYTFVLNDVNGNVVVSSENLEDSTYTLNKTLTNGIYKWKIKVSDGFNEIYGDEWTFTFVLVTGLEDEFSNETLTLYPNPGKSYFKLDLGNANKDARVTVYTTSGVRVIQKRFEKVSGTVSIDTKSLHDGVYLVSILVGETNVMRKLVIQ